MQCDISPRSTDKALRARIIQVHIFLEEKTQPFAEPNLEGAKLTNIAVHHGRPSQRLGLSQMDPRYPGILELFHGLKRQCGTPGEA